MEPNDYRDAISHDAGLLVDAAQRAGLDARVPSCPEWAVADLLGHIGRVHRYAAMNTTRPADAEFSSAADIETPEPAERFAWVREGADRLVVALERDPATPAWTWVLPHTVGFWQRRQAHETAMHRVDAQLAAGTITPIDTDLAADGIDEMLAIVPQRPPAASAVGDGESVHLHCTDVAGEWVATFGPSGIVVDRAHAKADAAVKGPASDLLLWCFGRGSIDALETFGDRALLDRFRSAASW